MPNIKLGAALLAMAATAAPQVHAETLVAPPVFVVAADSYLDVITMLEDAGYMVTGMKSTLLGRLKIRAQNREHVREMVVSRSTGEIKSDRILLVFAKSDGESGLVHGTASQNRTAGTESGATTNGAGVTAGVTDGSNSASAGVGSGGVSANVSTGGVSVGIGG